MFKLKSDTLYCFPALTSFDSLCVYILKKKRLKSKKKKGWQLKKPSNAEKGKEKKKCLRYRGDRVRTASHHHPLPDLDHQITGTDID